MKSKILIYGLLVLVPCGCSSMNNTEKDALAGGAAGTVAGAALTRGNPAGMVIGGLFGTLVGAGIGSDQDRRDRHDKAVAQAQANAAAYQARNQITLPDIVRMAQSGVGDALIVRQIDATNSAFNLTPDDIIYLRQNSVSDTVIGAMQARRYPRPVVVGPGPVYGPPPGVVVVEQGPPPPSVGFGVGIGGRIH